MRDAAPLIEDLRSELALSSESGRALFLQLSPGSDAGAVVTGFVREVRTRRRVRVAVADAADPATPAWRQVALRLTGKHRVAAALRRSAVEWSGVIPVLGPLIGAIGSTIAELTGGSASPNAAAGTGSAIDDVRRILAHGKLSPRLVVLENVEAADAAELAGAFALIQQIAQTRTLLIVAACSDERAQGFTDLLWEAERLHVGRLIRFAPHVSPEDAILLQCAAGIGAEFAVDALCRALGRTEDRVELQLRHLASLNLIRMCRTVEELGELTDVYAFTDPDDAARWCTVAADSTAHHGRES